jgi:hypothetical protein
MTEGMNNDLLGNHKSEIDSIQDRRVNSLMDSTSNQRPDMFGIVEESNIFRDNQMLSMDK